MATLTTRVNNETMLKLKHRAARVGMTPSDALREIATNRQCTSTRSPTTATLFRAEG